MSREAYRALGVRQSIFAESERDRLYDLFERYRSWLSEARLFDLSLVAQSWLPLATPRYDFVVIDDVQDLTPAQLLLVLRTLKVPNAFLLCGDSNQIVHPNFFAWNRVKTLFWRDEEIAGRRQLRVLRANFRNSEHVARIANTLLKIKHCRFGSVARESNFLVDPVGGELGSVSLLADKDNVKRALDEQTRQSTSVAVLVLREADKAERASSSEPPWFSRFTRRRAWNTKASCCSDSSRTSARHSRSWPPASARRTWPAMISTITVPVTRPISRSRCTSFT